MADQEKENAPSGEVAVPETTPETVPISHASALPLETNPPENEHATPSDALVETGLREKIRTATSSLFAGFRKGKGRPKKCRACGGGVNGCAECNWTGVVPGKADVVGAGDAIAPGREADLPLRKVEASHVGSADPDSGRASLFRRSVVAAARSVIKILTGIVKVYCDAAEIDAAFSKQAIARCQPDQDALDRWTESLDVVLKKHHVEPKHAEEIAFAVNSLELAAPFGVLLAELKGEIRRKRELEKAK